MMSPVRKLIWTRFLELMATRKRTRMLALSWVRSPKNKSMTHIMKMENNLRLMMGTNRKWRIYAIKWKNKKKISNLKRRKKR